MLGGHRCGVPCMATAGAVIAVISMMGNMTVCGAWMWQTYASNFSHTSPSIVGKTSGHDQNSTEEEDESALLTRCYTGMAEGAGGAVMAALLLAGFLTNEVPLLCVWAAWHVAFTAYDAVCAQRYAALVMSEQVVFSFSWALLLEIAWGVPLLMVITTLVFDVACLLAFAIVTTKFVYKINKGEYDMYIFQDQDIDDSFEMT